MKITICVTEFLRVCKAVRLRPEGISKLIRSEVRHAVRHYLNVGHRPYERKDSDGNHRNGFYH